MLENNKDLLLKKKNSKNFELHSQKAKDFLAKKDVVTMVPSFHVLREVFLINQEERAMDVVKALKIIRLRDGVDIAIAFWRKTARLILAPRALAGNIKIQIKKIFS